jgi:transcriptional regulator with XRE-family HTH domain
MGVAASHLSRLERGERGYNEALGFRLADYYGLSREELALLEGKIPDDVVRILQEHPYEIERLRQTHGPRAGELSDEQQAAGSISSAIDT